MNNHNGIVAQAQNHQKYLFQPSESLVRNWTLWMAKEAIVQLRDSKPVELDLGRLINQLDLSQVKIFPELFEQLRQEFGSIKTQISLAEQAEEAQKKLSDFFEQVSLNQLNQKSQALKQKTTEYLQESLSLDFQQASPKKLGEFLNYLATSLLEQKKDFDRQKSFYQEKENTAKKAYINLRKSQDLEGIANSLLLIFESKLQIAISDICSYTLFGLIQQCQTYCESCRRSEVILNKIEASLTAKASIDLISLPVFSELGRLDIDEQRQLLAFSTNHSLNFWGNTLSITWQQIEAKLLQNLEPVARQICLDFQTRFLNNVEDQEK